MQSFIEKELMFSIVTPSFNQGQFLEATICSVLEQDYPYVEYIVMDGGSTDGSLEIIERYSDRLTYWQSKTDGGQAEAIHKGFELSTGNILGWLNSDDVLLPGTLTKVAEVFSKAAQCQILIGNSVRINAQSVRVGKIWAYPLNFYRILYWGTGFDQPASFWTRNIYFEIGGLNTSYQFCFDYDMYLRIAKKTSIYRDNSFLAALRLHPDSKTSLLQEVRRREKEKIHINYGYYERSFLHRLMYRIFNGFGFKALQRYKQLNW